MPRKILGGNGNGGLNGSEDIEAAGKTDPYADRLVDFSEVRAQRLEEKRRKTERIFFKHILGVYSVVGNSGMRSVDLIEMSEDGCSFQVPYDPKEPWPRDTSEIPLRLYFSQDTYLEIIVRPQNSRPSIENSVRYVRYGCAVDTSTKSYPAYQQFVKFLKLYSEHARKDMGDVTMFYI